MARFVGEKCFTRIDARHGFWQVKLDEKSSKLCTMGTPWGHYRFLRLPFGVHLALEVFNRIMTEIFEDFEEVDTSMDDVVLATVD